MDTCIAIRTMTFKSGVAYLQAGGGIVYDSIEEEEWVETLNKLGANVKCLEEAESEFFSIQPRVFHWVDTYSLSISFLPPSFTTISLLFSRGII